jgi:HPt (histidine-containing phosphotransfer) domain-containing protein
MNAILYKPFTIRTLAGCLGILVAAKAPSAPEHHADSVTSEPAATTMTAEQREGMAILDTDLLERLDAMSRTGPSNFVKRVFELYLEHAPNTASELIRAFAAGGFEATGRAAHALKSMSYNIGAKRVAAIADDMERRAQSDGQKITNADIAELLRTLNETYDAIAARMKGSPAEVARAS